MRISISGTALINGVAASGVVAVAVPSSGRIVDGPELDRATADLIRAYLAGPTAARPLSAPGSVERLVVTGPQLILLIGVGGATPAELREAGAALARAADPGALAFAGPRLTADQSAAFVEGLQLGAYRFRVGGPAEPELTVRLPSADPAGVARGAAAARATCWTRELANTRSSIKTPAWLAAQARLVLVPLGVNVVEHDVEWLAERGFGGILAVGGGSAAPPRLIVAEWNPPLASPRGSRRPPHVVLIGKSITYDSGGLNIKPLDSMTSMYTDMSGGAAVLGALRLVAERELPIRVTGLLPAAENSVSGSAMRQGDVIRHYGGRTSEVNNTDAEGRLVLADALAYAVDRLAPTVLVDVATLTGAMKVALGQRVGGLFATSDRLADGLIAAGTVVAEPLWRLPLPDEYLPLINSEIADANNSPGNPGAIAAALYLRAFAGDVPWAHLDIAGPARTPDDYAELSRGATGFGARLLGEWLARQAG